MMKVLFSPTGELLTLREDFAIRMFGVLTWQSQVVQYPESGPPGVEHMLGEVGRGFPPVNTLLWRDDSGVLRGILNYYDHDYGGYEKPGNFLVLVAPGWRHRGIGSRLLNEMEWRWQPIDWGQQRYSREGIALISHFLVAQRGYQEGA